MEVVVKIEQDEFWWGGAVEDGVKMPFSTNSVYELDYARNETYNQINPVWVSNKGRFLRVEGDCKFTVKNGEIRIDGVENYTLESGYKTLKGAYIAASKKYFKKESKGVPFALLSSPQYCTWVDMLRDVSQEKVLSYAESIVDSGMSAGCLIIDDGWSVDFGDYRFTDEFPSPKQMFERLHELGFKVVLWVCPFVSPNANEYAYLVENNALVRAPSGEIAMKEWWNGTSAVLDGTNPFAFQWLEKKLNALMKDYGVDGFKFDAGDGMYYDFDDVTFAKTTPNGQSYLWTEFANKFEYSELRACFDYGGVSIVQRLADKKSAWGEKGLSFLIPNMIQAGLCGYGYCCPDMIGGGNSADFQDGSVKDEELFARACECSALMPMMQFSYSIWRSKNRQLKEIAVKFSHARDEYREYLRELTENCRKTNEPILRNLEYEFPAQDLAEVTDQFMLGASLLVAPVLKQGATTREVILPYGCKWRYVPTGKVYEGGQTITVNAPLAVLPYFVREK